MPRRRKSVRTAAPASPRERVIAYMLDEGAAGAAGGEFEELRGLLGAPRLAPAGQEPMPVAVSGPMIGSSGLGRAWYRFVETTHGRLVSGRAYLRAGAVRDLQVHHGIITAEVQGSRRYHVKIAVALPGGPQRASLRARLGAALTLRGEALHEPILGPAQELLPAPRHLVPFCQCLDTAPFCKHVCAALYGLGVRLDGEPELLLVLRGLSSGGPAAGAARTTLTPLAPEKALGGDLGALFGLELLTAELPPRSVEAVEEGTPAAAVEVAASTEAVEAALEGPAEIRRDHLRELGIPPPTIDAWLREGVLRRTGRHGVYERTPEASRRLAAHLEG